jgi:hypothetical protein
MQKQPEDAASPCVFIVCVCDHEISAAIQEKLSRLQFPQPWQCVRYPRKTYIQTPRDYAPTVVRVESCLAIAMQDVREAAKPSPRFGARPHVSVAHFFARRNRLELSQGKSAAYGIFPMDARVEEVVSSLNAAGFQSLDICVFLPPAHPIAEEVRTIKAVPHDLPAATAGARLVAWLATFGGVVIPGVGLFVGSREFLKALACGACQPRTSSGGPLAKLGIPLDDAARFEARVLQDASLIFVACDGSAQSEWAREILRLLRAEEVDAVTGFEYEICNKPSGSAWLI